MPHWWETVGPQGLPRFYIFLSRSSMPNKNYQHLNVVEVKPDAKELPKSYRSNQTRRVLLRTVPLYMGDDYTRGSRAFARAERVVDQLNSMPLATRAVDQEKGGLQRLFDKLWAEDAALYPDERRRIRK